LPATTVSLVFKQILPKSNACLSSKQVPQRPLISSCVTEPDTWKY